MTKRKSDIQRRLDGKIDIVKELERTGEHICNNAIVDRIGQMLIDSGIEVYPNHKMLEYTFNYKVKGYPILIDIGNDNYRKDRLAQVNGFKVLRFDKKEHDNIVLGTIRSAISKSTKSPVEIYVRKQTIKELFYSFFSK